MLGSPCSPCCGGCTAERAYPIWQQLLASQCSVSVVTDCKRQQAATWITPGFAFGEPSVIGKYFSDTQSAYMAQRFFHRPSPEWNTSYELSVDLQSSAALSSFPDGDRGVVEWKYADADIHIAVRAYVNDAPIWAILPPAANGNRAWAKFPAGQCDVYYTITVQRFAYSFYTRGSDFDPSPFASSAYTGTRPPLFSGQSETPFTTYLATASPPVVAVQEDTPSFETGFEVRSSAAILSGSAQLGAWWNSFGLPLTDADLQSASPGATLGVALDGGDTSIHAAPEVFCTPSGGQPTTTEYTAVYRRQVGQWVENTQPRWMSQPSFSAFWSWFSGARMSVQGNVSPFRYESVVDSSPEFVVRSTLSATISNE